MKYFMAKIRQKEIINAIFIIVFVSAFVLANMLYGFILPLYLVSMAAAFTLAIAFPRSGIYASIILTFIFERFFTLVSIFIGRTEWKLYPIDILFIGIIFGTIIYLIQRKVKIKLNYLDGILAIFIIMSGLYLAAGIISGSSFALSFSAVKYYTFYPILYFVIRALFQSREHLNNLFLSAFSGAIGILIFVLYGILNGGGLWTEFTPLSTEGIRILAFTHAFYLSLTLVAFLSYFIFKKVRQRLLFWLSFIFMALSIIGIVGSLMRHLWLSVGFSLATLFFIIPRPQKIEFLKIAKICAILIIICAIILFYFSMLLPTSTLTDFASSMFDSLLNRAGSFSSISGDESFSWRGTVWSEGIKEYLKQPLTGIGFGRFISVEIGSYHDFIETRNIHNSLLVILVQMGIASAGIFLWFMFSHIATAFMKKEKDWIDYAVIALSVNYSVAFLFQPYLETNMLAIFFWIIFGLVRITAKNYENSGNK